MNELLVAIPFKWGQSFYLPGDWIASILPTPSQSLLNEVKVSTAEDGGVTLQRFVAIPFKWGQSFYQWCGNNRPRTNLSQSLLNEVKVSTKIMSRPECQKCVAIPFKWGQSFYENILSTISLNLVAIPFKWGQSFYHLVMSRSIHLLIVAIPFKWGQSFYENGEEWFCGYQSSRNPF